MENLLDLQYLQFLDLSENLIETLKLGRAPGPGPWNVSYVVVPPLGSKLLLLFAIVLNACLSWRVGHRAGMRPHSFCCTDELPQSLLILNLCGNPCTNQDGYR